MLFISYASEDRPWVSQLSADLERDGHETWLDRDDLLGGDNWRDEIVRAIRECDAMVVVLSQSSAASREVAREAEVADNIGKRIIPVVKEACNPLGMSLILSGKHWIDFSTGDYVGARGQLVAAITGRADGNVQSHLSVQPTPQQLVGSWQVWIQHQFMPGFGEFEFHPNQAFKGKQSQPQGTVDIEGQWMFDGSFIRIHGVASQQVEGGFAKVMKAFVPQAMSTPYNLMLQISEVGDGFFKARSHDGFFVQFQWDGD